MKSDPKDRSLVGPPPSTETGAPPGPKLSEEQRAAAFASGRAPVDRSAALRAGTVPVPRKFILWAIAGFAFLALGGILAEHFVGNAGVQSLISTPPATLAGTATPPTTPVAPTGPSVSASPLTAIGLQHLAGHTAPALSLLDEHGNRWTLADARGRATVVSFVNAECNDICPVLAEEIVQADQLLGPRRGDVQFVVVNTDPLETSLAQVPAALSQTSLGGLENVTFLTGSIQDLSSVWKHYGIFVAVSNTTRVVSHSDLMDFITPGGRLSLQATPYANESSSGIYSLDAGSIHIFALGVADAATSLLTRTP